MKKTDFFLKEYPNCIYSLSTPLWMKREVKGGAIMQTWLVKGSEVVLAIDSPCPEIPGFHSFIEENFKLPVIMLNTHGHIDHIGCNKQFGKVYLAKEDWELASSGGVQIDKEHISIEDIGYECVDIPEGFNISLGNRELTAHHIPGHTRGSVVVYEEATSTLFGGDSVSRRILYGLSDRTPLSKYLERLEYISNLNTDYIYSSHDDFQLLSDMPKRIISNITENIKKTNLIWTSPIDGRKFKRIVKGKSEEDLSYFDFVIPVDMESER